MNKACAVYRDEQAPQPDESASGLHGPRKEDDEESVVEKMVGEAASAYRFRAGGDACCKGLVEVHRSKGPLPTERGANFKARRRSQRTLITGEYEDGKLGEIFLPPPRRRLGAFYCYRGVYRFTARILLMHS